MAKTAKTPFIFVGAPLLAVGAAFAAVAASGQPAFGYTAAGLLVPGIVLLATGLWSRRRRA
ncbi:hypothetical protein IAE37_003747 [Pseudomonas sp. S31]|uniref:hypothetical protein n=1 Tax=Pseudomonas sp. S31 TaxID=1564473 RepID=UPI00191176BE|nr:hypothetical protein [Pseudomonas sp. S31]MBK5001471.1 hypothetical protein [Pseudomonas sp. S31]